MTATTIQNRVSLSPPPSASELLGANVVEKKIYWDRSHYDSPNSQIAALETSSTLYVGNLAFGTRMAHLRSLFSKIGLVESIHMGLDRYKKTPCGFAFVKFTMRRHAHEAISCLSGTKLDGRIIRVELDAGFKQGRQYGRGVSGGQVRDDRRTTVDRGRVASSAKWEAPKKPAARPYPLAQQEQPSASSSTNTTAEVAGDKRRREESDEEIDQQQPASKNPRFQEDGSDEEME